MRSITWFTFFSAFLLFSGCVSKPQVAVTPADEELLNVGLEIDVFSARGFLGGSDYERYHFKDDVLWRECGHIVTDKTDKARSAALAGDEYFKKYRDLALETRRVERVSAQANITLRHRTNEMLQALSENTRPQPPPGSVVSLAGPGVFELRITYGDKDQHVVTSVDALSGEQSPSLKGASNLFSLLRSIGPVICNQTTFFGIPRLNNVS